MKKLIFIAAALCFAAASHAQTTLTIPLTKQSGYGAFNASNWVVFETPENHSTKPLIELAKGIPKTLLNPSIRVFHFQYGQFISYAYKKGMVEEKDLKWMTDLYDTSATTDKYVNEQLSIVIGNDRDSNIVAYFDTNNNQDFSDEEAVVYKKLTTEEEQRRASTSLPVKKVSFDYFDGTSIKTASTFVVASPYEGNWRMQVPQQFFAVGTTEHGIGEITVKGKKYPVGISNGFLSGVYNRKNLKVLIGEAGADTVESEKVNQPYFSGDMLNFDGEEYQIASVSPSGEQLLLTYNGYNPVSTGARLGRHAPEIAAKTIEGKPFKLSDLKGKYVLIDFWGTWCGPCAASIPSLREIYTLYGGKKFEIVSVAEEYGYNAEERMIKDETKLKQFVAEKEMRWTNLRQEIQDRSETAVMMVYRVNKFPTTYLLNPEGKIIAVDADGLELIELLKRNLGESKKAKETFAEKGNTVFELDKPNAKAVYVAGSFSNWQPRMLFKKDGKWMRRVDLKSGEHQYKFIVDNEWITDPKNTATKADGEYINSVLTVK